MRARQLMIIVTAVLLLVAGAAPAWAADTYKIDPAHSGVNFSVRHMMISNVKGHFDAFEGTVTYDPNDVSKWAVSGSIQATSIDTAIADRDKHLRSPDFFDVVKYPEITFKSKSFRKKEGGGYVCVGDLTLHGVTKQVEIPFEISGPLKDPMGATRLGGEAKLKVNRKEFGLNWSKTLDGGGVLVGDDVSIDLTGEAVKQEAAPETPKALPN